MADNLDGVSIDHQFNRIGSEFDQETLALADTLHYLEGPVAQLDRQIGERSKRPDLVQAVGREEAMGITKIISEALQDGTSQKEATDRVVEAYGSNPAVFEFILFLVQILGRPPRAPIFYSAILTSSVAAFEAHLGRLAETYFRASPEALHAVSKEEAQEFSLRDLQAMGSLEDAIEVAIRRRVDRIGNGGLSGWRRFFLDRMKIDLFEIEGGSALREIFERRHCFVHNGGRVTKRYATTVGSGRVGEQLRVDPTYVREAVDVLALHGMLLLGMQWSKFERPARWAGAFYERHALSALRDERFNYAYHVFRLIETWAVSEADQLVSSVNVWLARKGLGDSTVRPEVENWDVSTRSNLFKLARLCLLNEVDLAFELIPGMFAGGELTRVDLATWPLLAEVRADPRISSYFN